MHRQRILLAVASRNGMHLTVVMTCSLSSPCMRALNPQINILIDMCHSCTRADVYEAGPDYLPFDVVASFRIPLSANEDDQRAQRAIPWRIYILGELARRPARSIAFWNVTSLMAMSTTPISALCLPPQTTDVYTDRELLMKILCYLPYFYMVYGTSLISGVYVRQMDRRQT